MRYKQIATKQTFMGNEIRMLHHEAVLRLRDYTHHDYPEDPSTPPLDQGFHCPNAQRYYELAGYEWLNPAQRKELLAMLEQGNRDDCMEFWGEEADHLWGHRRLDWNTIHKNSSHSDLHYEVQEALVVALFGKEGSEGHIYQRQRDLSPTLETFASLDTIYQELKRCVEKELDSLSLEEVLHYIMVPLCGSYCVKAASAHQAEAAPG
jgi:hypothetical protein